MPHDVKSYLKGIELVTRPDRVKEKEMWGIVREISNYLIFVSLIVVVVHGNRDYYGFQLKRNMVRNFVEKNNFPNVTTANDFWKWAHSTVVQELRASFWYNGKPPYGLKGYGMSGKIHFYKLCASVVKTRAV